MQYEPHEYQKYAIDYIETHPLAAVLLDMGLGKTSITLTAIADLLFDSFEVHKVLVAMIGEQKKQTPLTEANTADGKKRLTTHTNLAPKPVDQEEIIRDVNYYQAQKVAQSMLDRGLISLDEFNKLTQINRDTFSPFLVEIMPEIR